MFFAQNAINNADLMTLKPYNLWNFSKPNLINAYIIIIVFAINGKQRIEGADGTVRFYSSDS